MIPACLHRINGAVDFDLSDIETYPDLSSMGGVWNEALTELWELLDPKGFSFLGGIASLSEREKSLIWIFPLASKHPLLDVHMDVTINTHPETGAVSMSVSRKTFVNWQDYETKKSTDWVSLETLDPEKVFRRFLDTHLVDEIESLDPNYWGLHLAQRLRAHAAGAIYLMDPVYVSQEVVDMWSHVLSGGSPGEVSPVPLPNGEVFDWNLALEHPDLGIETVRDIYRAALTPPFEFDA